MQFAKRLSYHQPETAGSTKAACWGRKPKILDSSSGPAILDEIQLVCDYFLVAGKVQHFQSESLQRVGMKVKHKTWTFPDSLPPETVHVLPQLYVLSCQSTAHFVSAASRLQLLYSRERCCLAESPPTCCLLVRVPSQNSKYNSKFPIPIFRALKTY